ncbi:MAG: hypothetical protein NVS2B14_00130 [Chamaesiphon sp.]
MTVATKKEIVIRFNPESSDDFEFNDPSFKFGDEVVLMSELADGTEPNDCIRYEVIGMQLDVFRYKRVETLTSQPEWFYGLRKKGWGGCEWVHEGEICLGKFAHLVSQDIEF